MAHGNEDRMNVYEFKVNRLDGREISLEEYKDKVILIVNTASKCGLTPQLTGLVELFETYKEKGFVVLGFPCNQFGRQDPDGEKRRSCLLNYGVQFPMFAQVRVNGENASPLYKYLKSEAGGIFGNDIKWNFTKFLVDKSGRVVKRYSPLKTPEDIEKDILNLL